MPFNRNPFAGRRGLGLGTTSSSTEEVVDNLFAEDPPIYLVILDYFKNFFVKHGVDYEQLRLIIQVKMATNTRALENPLANTMKRSTQSTLIRKKPGILKSLIFQGIFGILFSLLLLLPIPDFSVYFLLYSVFFLLFITILIPQLAQVFLSGEDAHVLPVRPVDARVLSLAKVIQVSIYYFLNFVSYIGPTLVVGFFTRDVGAALLTILTSFLLSVFALLLALALYLLVGRFFSGEKLRNMITYVQILLSILSFATYQLITPLIDVLGLSGLAISPWLLIWPPTWFAAPYLLVTEENTSIITYIATILGIGSVVGLAALYFAQAAKLEQRLQDLALQKDGEDQETGRIRDFFSRVLCRSPQERAYFRFSWQMMRNERSFKTAVYPLIVTYAVLPYIMILTTKSETHVTGLFLGMPMFFLYMSIVGIANVVLSLRMSDYWEAGWIFRVLPKKSDGEFATALAKSLRSRLYVPLYVIQFPLQYLIHGRQGVLTVAILFFLSYLVTLALILKIPLTRPFTQKRSLVQLEGRSYMLFLFGLWFGLAVFHAALHSYVPFGLEIYIGVLACLTLVGIRFFRSKKVFYDY